MSPDPGAELVVPAVIAAAVRRARVLVLIEAAVWAVAAAAITPVAAALLAPAVALARWRSTSRASILRALERAQPDSRNLFVTVDELARETLIAKPLVRARVFGDAAAHAKAIDLRAVVPVSPLLRAAVFAALAWTTAGAVQLWRAQAARGGTGALSSAASPSAAPAGARLQVSVTVQPPAYTGLEETKAVDPDQVQAVEGSALVLSIDASASAVNVEQDGRTHALTRGADGRFAERLRVTKTGYLAVIADTARRLIPVIVSPDALPVVRLTAPGRDLVYAGGNPRIAFDARATDDYGLRSLVLRYTKVTGSGENYEFKEGEIPLAVNSASAREWTGSVSRSLAELDLHDGDMLVYRAVAADARPGDGTATSDAFFIEISKLGVAAGDAFTLPEEESKYALSQQMLIVKTERLHQKRGSLSADDLAEQSLNLAVEQRMIRAEFVFMLGGEINDEEVEAEQSVELQAGRLQNRGQRDLRAATIAMSQAEKLLTGVSTADALVAERAAVTALQRAFSRDRYILRAMATRSQLDPARRLTGTLAEATGWRRIPPDPSVDRRTALLQDLLRGIAELTAIPPGPKGPGLQSDAGTSRPGPEGPGLQPDSDARRAGPFGPAGPVQQPDARRAGPFGPAGPVQQPDARRAGPFEPAGPVQQPDARRPGPFGPAGPVQQPDARRAGPFGPAVPTLFRQRALVVAEEAIRIDPSSAALRTVATELQRAADSLESSTRSVALAAASSAAASEARRTQAGAPVASSSIAPALSGAFADAARRGR